MEEEEEGRSGVHRQAGPEHAVTREHAGGSGGRPLRKSRILSLILDDSTVLLLRQGPHTCHILGRNG